VSDPNLQPAPILDLPALPENKWQREYQAFLRMLPALLETHRNKFVAIHEEKLVDSGDDKVALALRVYTQHGYLPIYVGQVVERPIRPERLPSPRLLNSESLP
jgi:hypothetical protein